MMKKFKKEIERLNEDREFSEFLSYEEDSKKVHNTLISNAKEEGEAIGEKRGEKRGKKQKALEIAKNMLNKKFSKEDISSITGLTIEEIENL